MNFQDAPAGLGLNADGNARKFGDDRKFITSARNGEERTLRRPMGNRQIARERGNAEASGKRPNSKLRGLAGIEGLEKTAEEVIELRLFTFFFGLFKEF